MFIVPSIQEENALALQDIGDHVKSEISFFFFFFYLYWPSVHVDVACSLLSQQFLELRVFYIGYSRLESLVYSAI